MGLKEVVAEVRTSQASPPEPFHGAPLLPVTLRYTVGSFPSQAVSTLKSEEEKIMELSVDLMGRAEPGWPGTYHQS